MNLTISLVTLEVLAIGMGKSPEHFVQLSSPSAKIVDSCHGQPTTLHSVTLRVSSTIVLDRSTKFSDLRPRHYIGAVM